MAACGSGTSTTVRSRMCEGEVRKVGQVMRPLEPMWG